MVCKQSTITGLICIIISVLAVFAKYKMIKNKRKYQEKANDAESKYSATFVDFIQNIITVKKLNIENFCENKITKKYEDYYEKNKINTIKRANANSVFSGLMNLLYIVVLISTIKMVKNGQDGLPYLLFYMSALGKVYPNLNGIVKLIDIVEKFKIAKKQLDQLLNGSYETLVVNNFESLKLLSVEFSYEKKSELIKIPEFTLNKGDKISIMGESGQGKTTTINILAGLYNIKNGEFLINGENKKDKKLDLVFVSQEVDLFDLSIRENLSLGKQISDEKIIKLIEDAGLKKWYLGLKDGLDTIVGEKGVKLSAGQKQRLNLIRGILIDKEVYFLDEPTSNLDSSSEKRIINMIEKYLKDKTYVIVTHRENLKTLCKKHYIFEEHEMKEEKGVIYNE